MKAEVLAANVENSNLFARGLARNQTGRDGGPRLSNSKRPDDGFEEFNQAFVFMAPHYDIHLMCLVCFCVCRKEPQPR